ncbi:MAG: 2-phospho-L-lactate guanylyltransferase [Candidatus Bathyarchaeia archaeon]
MSIFAIIPVKTLSKSKRRLSSVLSLDERQMLTLSMFEDVLRSMTISQVIDRVVVISPDLAVSKLAECYDVDVIAEKTLRGMNSAVGEAIEYSLSEGAQKVLVVPADIPLVASRDLEEIISLGKDVSVVISPSKSERGTNALLLSPPNIIPTSYGQNSFKLHINAAMRRGIQPEIYRSKRVALDIDTPEDLIDFINLKPATLSYKLLMRIAIADRLRASGQLAVPILS